MNFEIDEILFIIFNIVIFSSFLFTPLLFLILKIFYYRKSIDYLKLNYMIIAYYVPFIFIVYLIENLSFLEKGAILYLITILLCNIIYFIPLTYLINRHIFLQKDILKSTNLFLIFTFLQLSLYYILYNVAN
jgi:hypothetical protein